MKGFEPLILGPKFRRLTTWLHPIFENFENCAVLCYVVLCCSVLCWCKNEFGGKHFVLQNVYHQIALYFALLCKCTLLMDLIFFLFSVFF